MARRSRSEVEVKVQVNGFDSFEQALAAARAAKAAEMEAKPKRKSKPKPKVNQCICGCGTMVAGRFASGHDGRMLGMFIRMAKGDDGVTLQDGHRDLFTRWVNAGMPHGLKALIS